MSCPCGRASHPGLAGTAWRLGTAPRDCWLYENDPAYRALWDGTPRPPPPPPRPMEEWPRWARALARRRQPGEAGVGDTLERVLRHKGGDLFKATLKKFGIDCGCGDRQAWMNRECRYAPP